MTMARPYSDDLRRKLLEAYDHGKGSLVELAERLPWGCDLSRTAGGVEEKVWSALPFKKKSLHAQERDTEANRKRRQEFVQALGGIAPEKLIFLDESGVSTQMTRRYARGRGGARI